MGYYHEIEAEDEDEAIRMLHAGEIETPPEPCGFCGVDHDSITATPLCGECRHDVGDSHATSCVNRKGNAAAWVTVTEEHCSD